MKKLLIVMLMALNIKVYAAQSLQSVMDSYFTTPDFQISQNMTNLDLWVDNPPYLSFSGILAMGLTVPNHCAKIISDLTDHPIVDISECPYRQLKGQFENGTKFTVLF